jgi:hypothetical protein
MADYPGDDSAPFSPYSFPFLILPHVNDHVVIDPSKPSAVRVLGKSMYVLAVGWLLSIGWLWFETVQQHQLRRGGWPPLYAVDTLAGGLFPALFMAAVGWLFAKVCGRAPYRELERREWWHAFWWSLMPNALLLVTVWVMLQEGQ